MRLVAALLALGGPALALDLPPGAERTLAEAEAPGELALATGPWAPGGLPTTPLQGAVTREAWRLPGWDGTTLGLLDALRADLERDGWETLFACEAEDCGGFDFREAVDVLPPPAMFVDLGDFRYLAATRGDEGLSLLVSRGGEAAFVQVETVDPAGAPDPAATPLVAPETAAEPLSPRPEAAPGGLGARLEAEGRVVLDGLAFASGSAALAGGGDAALGALAAWLAGEPGRRVAIVGHTDATGPLEANVALSRRRAEAVAARLAAEFGVAAGRIEAHGMGWLAPRATNLTPEGREANRRVEAVVLP